MNRRYFLGGALAVGLWTPASAQSPIAAASREAVGGAETAEAKVRAAIAWTHDQLDWTATDYEDRTPDQVLRRGGGNCYEQARVVRALLEPAGVSTRLTREVNMQPPSEERQHDAEVMVAERGVRFSVFGARHNDHVWTEYRDEERGEWVPADPTLNVIGVGEWVNARLGFGERPVHEVIPYADMLFPIAVVVPLGNGRFERRTDRLLIEGFATHIVGVWNSPAWPRWVDLARRAEENLIGAMLGTHNMHDDEALHDELTATYAALRADWNRAHRA